MRERVHIGTVEDFSPGQLTVVDIDKFEVVVVRLPHGFCAVENSCPHEHLTFDGGKVENGILTCPHHHSKFDVCTGQNFDWVPGVTGVKMPDWTREDMARGRDPRNVMPFLVEVENSEVYVLVNREA